MSYEPKVNDIFRQIGKNGVYATKRKVLEVSKGKVATITVNDVFGNDGHLEIIDLHIISDFYEKMCIDNGSYIPQVGDRFCCGISGTIYRCERRDSDNIHASLFCVGNMVTFTIENNIFTKVW